MLEEAHGDLRRYAELMGTRVLWMRGRLQIENPARCLTELPGPAATFAYRLRDPAIWQHLLAPDVIAQVAGEVVSSGTVCPGGHPRKGPE